MRRGGAAEAEGTGYRVQGTGYTLPGGGRREAEEEVEDLGGLLLRFYWYYGHKLDLSSSIELREASGRSAAQSNLRRQGRAGWRDHHRNMLSINDPANPDTDIGSKAFRFLSVRRLLRLR